MADKAKIRREVRATRKKGLKKRIRGTAERPRLCVFRSLKYTYAQIISDEDGRVICSASTKTLIEGKESSKGVEASKKLGQKIAELAKANKIEGVVFDRNGYLYHGRVAAVADGAREGGLNL